MATKVKELAKSRTECAEKEATIAAMKFDMQALNKAIEEAKSKVQNSEEEVKYTVLPLFLFVLFLFIEVVFLLTNLNWDFYTDNLISRSTWGQNFLDCNVNGSHIELSFRFVSESGFGRCIIFFYLAKLHLVVYGTCSFWM